MIILSFLLLQQNHYNVCLLFNGTFLEHVRFLGPERLAIYDVKVL